MSASIPNSPVVPITGDKLAVLVGSCDKYSFLWDNFVTLYKRHVNLNGLKHFIVSESARVRDDLFEPITTGNLTWTEMISQALSEINAEYIFFLLDDYFITENLTPNAISRALLCIEDFSADKVVLGPHSIFYKYEQVYWYRNRTLLKLHQDSAYLSSTQPALWRKDFFLSLLSSPQNPWNFEKHATLDLKKRSHKIFLLLREQPVYFNAFNQGKPSPGYEDFLALNNLPK
jgi:hypothetical protein